MISEFPFLLDLLGGTAFTIDLFGSFWDPSLWDSDRDQGENTDSESSLQKGNAIFQRLVKLLRKLAQQGDKDRIFDTLRKLLASLGREEDYSENEVEELSRQACTFLSSLRNIETDALEREFWNCEYSITGLLNVWKAVGPEVDVLREGLSHKNKEELISFLVLKRVPLIYSADMVGCKHYVSTKNLGTIDQFALGFLTTYVISEEKDCHAALSSLEKRREEFRLQNEQKVLQHSLLLFITTF